MEQQENKKIIKVKFVRLYSTADAPRKSTDGAAAWDLSAHHVEIEPQKNGSILYTVHTGIAVEIPKGYFGDLRARSSVVFTGLGLGNGAGVIDSDYRGEITGRFYLHAVDGGNAYEAGERCLQLIIAPCPPVEFEEAEELSDTDRGTGGYGSTGR